MSENVIQASFAAGELSPSLFARVDFAKYRSGAATMRNFFVDYRSGASTRPGTEFIRPAGSNKVRLVRFQQSVNVTYVLEFTGNGKLRFISDGASIVESGFTLPTVTNANPATLTVPGHNFINGDTIFVSGVGGMPQIDNRYFNVVGVVGASFNISNPLTGASIDSTSWGVLTSAGLVQRVYTISTPYSGDELSQLKFSQNASIMNITHPKHPPYKLQLFTAINWTLTPAVFGSTAPAPTTVGVSSSGVGTVSYKYTVTSVDNDNQESVNGPVTIISTAVDLRTVAGSNLIGWNNTGAFAYNIYGSSASYSTLTADIGGIGLIGSVASTGALRFVDSNIAADFAQTPPIHQNPFTSVNPACSSYFQQRLVYANGGGDLVDRFWTSKTGAYYNFDISNPSQADDSITAALVSLEVNEIKSLIPVPTGLLAFTTKGVWQISGGAGGVATQGGPITPATIIATPQAYVGANDVPPLLINYDVLFVQQKGSIVRDLAYNIYSNIYTGNDISILSSHLFYGHQVLEWAYAEEPFKQIWCVREDGTLLCLTLLKEQDMYGWSRHDTRGNFKSVCSVTEGHVDATYFAVERPNPIGPGNVLQIERLAERSFRFGAEDAWCVDAGVSTVHNFPDATLNISNQDADHNVTIVADSGVFNSGMVGWVMRVGGGIINIINFVDTQNLIGHIVRPIADMIPNDPLHRPDDALPGTWSIDPPFTTFFGLDHLEGQEVAVLADGGVVNGLVVQNGSITLPLPVTNVTVGYAFQAQLQTMYLDLGSEINSVQGKRKKIAALTVRCKDSRGVKAGRTFDTVTPIKELNRTTLMGLPIPLITADERIIMDPIWDVPGQICIQVDDPLPATVLGVVPEIIIGDTPK